MQQQFGVICNGQCFKISQGPMSRIKKLSAGAVRFIRQSTLRSRKSAADLKKELHLPVSVRRTQQMFHATPYLCYKRRKPAPFQKKEHREKRVKWACSMLEDLNVNWKPIVFTDEKKFIWSGPDVLDYYWHDLCQNPDDIEW